MRTFHSTLCVLLAMQLYSCKLDSNKSENRKTAEAPPQETGPLEETGQSEATKHPESKDCDPAKLAHHAALKAQYDAATAAMKPWAQAASSGQLDFDLEKLAFIEIRQSHFYGGSHTILDVKAQRILSKIVSDGVDQCLGSDTYYDEGLTAEEWAKIKASLAGLTALDDGLPQCSRDLKNKFPSPVHLFLDDGKKVGFHVKDATTCISSDAVNDPVVETMVKTLIYEASAPAEDATSPD